jgi:glutaredoxin
MDTEITLYTRPGCSLCDTMKGGLEARGYRVREVNIDADPELARLYGRDIPVAVTGDGAVVARHRLPPV